MARLRRWAALLIMLADRFRKTVQQGVVASPTHLAAGQNNTPFFTIYSRSGDTFTKLTDPATLPPANVRGATFSNNGDYLAVAHNTTRGKGTCV